MSACAPDSSPTEFASSPDAFLRYLDLVAASASKPAVLIVCPHCMANNDETACFCHFCLTPLRSHAEIDPMYRIYSEWNTYRKAIAAPTRLITVIGMWLIFVPGLMVVSFSRYFPQYGLCALARCNGVFVKNA